MAALGFIGNSTLNQILQGEPLPPERAGDGYAKSRQLAAAGVQRYWATERPAREAARSAISAAAAAQVGALTDREITIAGAIALLVRGFQEQAIPERRARPLHQQRPCPDQVLPQVPR